MERNGNADRWGRIQARRDDPIEQLVAAVNQVFTRPGKSGPISPDLDPVELFARAVSARTPRKRQGGVNRLAQALASHDEYVRDAEARRADLEKRNGAKARAAFRQWQQARAEFAAEGDFDPELSPLVAASMHVRLLPLRIY